MKALAQQRLRLAVALLLWCALALALAAWARYGLVEAGAIAAHCDAGGAGWRCTVRAAVIQAFILQRLGWAALAMGLAAFLLRSRWLAVPALFAACAGLVLYSTELCAPAALLAALVFAGESARHGPDLAGHNTAPAMANNKAL